MGRLFSSCRRRSRSSPDFSPRRVLRTGTLVERTPRRLRRFLRTTSLRLSSSSFARLSPPRACLPFLLSFPIAFSLVPRRPRTSRDRATRRRLSNQIGGSETSPRRPCCLPAVVVSSRFVFEAVGRSTHYWTLLLPGSSSIIIIIIILGAQYSDDAVVVSSQRVSTILRAYYARRFANPKIMGVFLRATQQQERRRHSWGGGSLFSTIKKT